MRLIHLGDLHLGKFVLEVSMLEEQRAFLRYLADYAAANAVDAVLLAGDIYDRSVPPAEAVQVLDEFWCARHRAGIPVLAVPGNHDSPERLAFGSRLFASEGIHMAGPYDGTLPVVELRDAYGPVRVYLLPFLKPVMVRAALEAEVAGTDEAVRAALAVSPPDPACRNILVAHQFVCAGGLTPAVCDSETPCVGGSEPVDASAFDAFDYVALGHLHRAQKMGRETVRYAGSPLRYSLSEAAHVKSFPVVTLGEKGRVDIELVPIVPRRQLRRIQGELTALLQAGLEDPDGREDYIWAVLEEDALNPAERLRAVYPHLLHVETAQPAVPDEETGEAEAAPQSVGELFAAFYAEMTGRPLTGEQRAVVAQTLKNLEVEP